MFPPNTPLLDISTVPLDLNETIINEAIEYIDVSDDDLQALSDMSYQGLADLVLKEIAGDDNRTLAEAMFGNEVVRRILKARSAIYAKTISTGLVKKCMTQIPELAGNSEAWLIKLWLADTFCNLDPDECILSALDVSMEALYSLCRLVLRSEEFLVKGDKVKIWTAPGNRIAQATGTVVEWGKEICTIHSDNAGHEVRVPTELLEFIEN